MSSIGSGSFGAGAFKGLGGARSQPSTTNFWKKSALSAQKRNQESREDAHEPLWGEPAPSSATTHPDEKDPLPAKEASSSNSKEDAKSTSTLRVEDSENREYGTSPGRKGQGGSSLHGAQAALSSSADPIAVGQSGIVTNTSDVLPNGASLGSQVVEAALRPSQGLKRPFPSGEPSESHESQIPAGARYRYRSRPATPGSEEGPMDPQDGSGSIGSKRHQDLRPRTQEHARVLRMRELTLPGKSLPENEKAHPEGVSREARSVDSWKTSTEGLRTGQTAGKAFSGPPEHALSADLTAPVSTPSSRTPSADGPTGSVFRQQELLRLIETATARLSSHPKSELQVSYRSLNFGSVTVNLQEQGGTLNIVVQASRDLDIWRSDTTRDQLVQALEGLGYDDVLMEFGMHDSGGEGNSRHFGRFGDDAEIVRLPGTDDEWVDEDWTEWKEVPPEGKVF